MTIEIKAKIEDLEKVENSIKNIGAQFVSEVEATDIYFNSKEKTNLKIGIYPEGHLPKTGNFLLFFEHDPVSKKFQFKQMEIDDVETLRYILDKVLGIKIVIKSKRKFYKLDNVIILIVFISKLGYYLCLQGENEKEIHEIFDKLGIKETCIETKSFDMLMLEK